MTVHARQILEETPDKATAPGPHADDAAAEPGQGLVVFADDWGRHPSSCQHLVRHLLPRHPTLWVNTIGTRRPTLSVEDLGKIAHKARQWLFRGANGPQKLPKNLQVVSPRMYPGFRTGWQQRLNRQLIARQVGRSLRSHLPIDVAVTTLPITADLVGAIPVKHWVYYCVDDFSVWPGLDGTVMQAMEQRLVDRVDHVIVVSETLRDRIASMGKAADLLTHGIDLDHWQQPTNVMPPVPFVDLPRPIALFWGLIDQRLDMTWCNALAQTMGQQGGSFVLVGPQQSPDAELTGLPATHLVGPAEYADLPALAAAADVLVMPYADLPVTRAMQPLKFKEYLATGKPAVVRDLPATRDWAGAADVVADVQSLMQRVMQRIDGGLPDDQRQARQRLAAETWATKAAQFEAMVLGSR